MKKNMEKITTKGRVLARVLAEELKDVVGAKSNSCGWGCDEIVTDSWKLQEDGV